MTDQHGGGCMCICVMWTYMCYDVCVEVRAQLCDVSVSFPLQAPGIYSGGQDCTASPSPTTSFWSSILGFCLFVKEDQMDKTGLSLNLKGSPKKKKKTKEESYKSFFS